MVLFMMTASDRTQPVSSRHPQNCLVALSIGVRHSTGIHVLNDVFATESRTFTRYIRMGDYSFKRGSKRVRVAGRNNHAILAIVEAISHTADIRGNDRPLKH